MVASRSKGRRRQAELLDHDVEGAPLAAVAPEHAFDIEGVAPKRSATATTSAGATNRNTASGSTKRRISHGQAMRSIFGRARVTQTVRPCASRGGSLDFRHERQLAAPGVEAALERLGGDADVPQPGGDAVGELLTAMADDYDRATCEFPPPIGGLSIVTSHRAGVSRWSAAESSSVRTSMRAGRLRRADQACELFSNGDG